MSILSAQTVIYNFLEKYPTDIFLNGQCYYFAKILQERFKPFYQTKIYYNPIDNHFACAFFLEGRKYLYDASGLIANLSFSEISPWVEWTEYIKVEPIGAARVYRDCIWQLNIEAWDELPEYVRQTPWLME